MDHRSVEQFYVVVAPGLEQVCADELAALGIAVPATGSGGIGFTGRLADLYRANLQLRTASRVLVRFGRLRCRSFPDLYQQAARLPWGRFVRAGTSPQWRVTCRNSRLMHTGRLAETLAAAVDHAMGRATQPPGVNGQLMLARLVDDVMELSVDSSGELLHRRGYRTSVAAAPLRETLAAGVLQLLGWNGDRAAGRPPVRDRHLPAGRCAAGDRPGPGGGAGVRLHVVAGITGPVSGGNCATKADRPSAPARLRSPAAMPRPMQWPRLAPTWTGPA